MKMGADQAAIPLGGVALAVAQLRDSDEKARATLSLVRSAIASGNNERSIFGRVYGDEGGREYWAAFLQLAMTEGELIRALATHLATPARVRGGDGQFIPLANMPTPRVAKAFEALPAALRHGKTKAYPEPILRALAAKGSPALPPSLLSFLSPQPIAAPRKKRPGPAASVREPLRVKMRQWVADNGAEEFAKLKLEQAISLFGGKQTTTLKALNEVREEFEVQG